ncbi:fungal hydrophobin [Dendrothele bispora CBS 962.96]|uniref:Hydrophobin n=1 Tax=Dendrothele bispora (strain CBS 962.96) TaxID=1314807 RepID=A0A4S8KWI5_DENBC|nr:fungal hydrophobin [Dendrothele bispora CBS 962.96]
MQFKLFVAASLASLVAAVPAGNVTSTVTSKKCNTGSLQCCQSIQKASEAPASNILGVLGIAVQDANIPVGLTCDPISVIGVGGQNCAAQAACCKQNNFNGVVALGCTPINLGL